MPLLKDGNLRELEEFSAKVMREGWDRMELERGLLPDSLTFLPTDYWRRMTWTPDSLSTLPRNLTSIGAHLDLLPATMLSLPPNVLFLKLNHTGGLQTDSIDIPVSVTSLEVSGPIDMALFQVLSRATRLKSLTVKEEGPNRSRGLSRPPSLAYYPLP